MARKRTWLIVPLAVLVTAVSACKGQAPLGAKAVRGWAEQEGYTWDEGPDEILTEQAFFDYINGAAQPIIDLGWKRSLYGVLTKDQSRLRLTVHEMADARAAVALLDESTFGDTEPVALGERAVYWDRGAFSRGIVFKKGNLICELTLVKGGTKEKTLSLASSLEALTE